MNCNFHRIIEFFSGFLALGSYILFPFFGVLIGCFVVFTNQASCYGDIGTIVGLAIVNIINYNWIAYTTIVVIKIVFKFYWLTEKLSCCCSYALVYNSQEEECCRKPCEDLWWLFCFSDILEAVVALAIAVVGVLYFTSAIHSCPLMAFLPICLGFPHAAVDLFAVYEIISERRHEQRIRKSTHEGAILREF